MCFGEVVVSSTLGATAGMMISGLLLSTTTLFLFVFGCTGGGCFLGFVFSFFSEELLLLVTFDFVVVTGFSVAPTEFTELLLSVLFSLVFDGVDGLEVVDAEESVLFSLFFFDAEEGVDGLELVDSEFTIELLLSVLFSLVFVDTEEGVVGLEEVGVAADFLPQTESSTTTPVPELTLVKFVLVFSLCLSGFCLVGGGCLLFDGLFSSLCFSSVAAVDGGVGVIELFDVLLLDDVAFDEDLSTGVKDCFLLIVFAFCGFV